MTMSWPGTLWKQHARLKHTSEQAHTPVEREGGLKRQSHVRLGVQVLSAAYFRAVGYMNELNG